MDVFCTFVYLNTMFMWIQLFMQFNVVLEWWTMNAGSFSFFTHSSTFVDAHFTIQCAVAFSLSMYTSCRLFLLSSCPLVLFCFNSPHEALSLHVHAHYNSLFLCLSHTLMHTHKLCPLLILSWGFWPRAGYFSWSRFSQAPTGLFEHDSHWALTHYQCSKSFTENLLSLIL